MTPKELGARPAHPHISGDASGIGVYKENGGLTIRQEYKKAALQGLLANERWVWALIEQHDSDPTKILKDLSEQTRDIADALLAEDAEHEKGNT